MFQKTGTANNIKAVNFIAFIIMTRYIFRWARHNGHAAEVRLRTPKLSMSTSYRGAEQRSGPEVIW